MKRQPVRADANWRLQAGLTSVLSTFFVSTCCLAQGAPPANESAPPPNEDTASLEFVTVESSVLLESDARIELDRNEVVRTAAVNLAEVLTHVPNVKVQTNSRGEQVFALRGSDQRQVALTLDGASVVSAWDGQLDLSLLPSSAIESVAITRGPASVLQGPNALSGAVNVISRRVESQGRNHALAVNAGSEWRSLDGFLGQRRGQHSFSAALGWSESDGFEAGGEDTLLTGSDFRNRSAVLGWGFRYADESTIGMTFLAVDNSKGVTPERTSSNPRFWRYPEIEKNQLIAFGRHALDTSSIDYSMFLSRARSRIDQFTDETYSVLDNTEDGRDRAEGGRVQWSTPLTATQDVVIELDWTQSEHLFRERASSSSFTPFSQILSQLAVEWHNSAGPWKLLLGAAYDNSKTPDTGILANPGSRSDWAATGALNYSLSSELSLDFSLGRKTRFPSLRESFNGALGRFVLNPDLGPETAVSAAVGVVGHHSDFDWEVRGFATETTDGITRISLPNGQFTRINLTSSRLYGVEFGFDANLADWLEARIEGTVLHARAEDSTGSYDAYMEYRPGVNLGSEFIFTLPANWRAMARVRYLAEEHGLRESSPTPLKLPSYVLWNLSVERELGSTNLGEFAFALRLENVLDEFYQSQWGLPAPGRRASIGFTWTN